MSPTWERPDGAPDGRPAGSTSVESGGGTVVAISGNVTSPSSASVSAPRSRSGAPDVSIPNERPRGSAVRIATSARSLNHGTTASKLACATLPATITTRHRARDLYAARAADGVAVQ
jgi:hypothetical protein